MVLWVDAQLSPALAPWIAQQFGVQAYSAKFLGFRDSTDRDIFDAAKSAGAVVLTKDKDFVRLLEDLGPPPQVIWLTLGNTSNARLRSVLVGALGQAMHLLIGGDSLVEIGDPH